MHTPAAGSGRRLNLRSLVLGIVVVLVGIGVLIGGVAAQLAGSVCSVSRRCSAEPCSPSRGPGLRRTLDASSRSARKNAEAAGERLGDRLGRRWDQRMEGER